MLSEAYRLNRKLDDSRVRDREILERLDKLEIQINRIFLLLAQLEPKPSRPKGEFPRE